MPMTEAEARVLLWRLASNGLETWIADQPLAGRTRRLFWRRRIG